MDVVIKVFEDPNTFVEEQQMEIDGKDRLCVGGEALCESPKDAIIGRGLVSCGDVARYMKEAHKAGANGEPFSLKVMWNPEYNHPDREPTAT